LEDYLGPRRLLGIRADYWKNFLTEGLEVLNQKHKYPKLGGGAAMRIMGLSLMLVLLFCGCASFQHSEYIDTDQLDGNASGKYTLNSSGPSGTFAIAGGGGGGIGSGGNSGFGAGALTVNSSPPAITPYNFARAVAMINYSKKLKSVKYDETGGIIEYEFDQKPLPRRSAYPAVSSQSKLPSSFGYQPVE